MSEGKDPHAQSEAPSDPPGRFVPTRAGDLHVVAEGDLGRPAVVCVHGVPGSARDFRYLGPALARRGLCAVRIDLPGFGGSPRGALRGPGSAALAALVHDVARGLGFARFAVCGHSFGGTVALACAALYPDDVVALLLINSVGVRRHRGLAWPHELTGRAAPLFEAPLLRDVLPGAMARLYQSAGLRTEAFDGPTLRLHAEFVGGLDFVAQRSFARRVRAPTLVASADNDVMVPPAIAHSLLAALSGAPLRTHRRLRQGGHALQKWSAGPIADWAAERLGTRA